MTGKDKGMGKPKSVIRIIRKKELFPKVGMSDATVYRLEKKGKFPKRVQIGPNSVGWIEGEVDQWIERLAAER